MELVFPYLIKTNIALVFFYLMYALFFKSDTFFKLRRAYLLFAILFSLVFSFFTIDAFGNIIESFKTESTATAETLVLIGDPTMAVATDVANAKPLITFTQALCALWIIGSLIFFVRFLMQLVSIIKIRIRSRKTSVDGIEVYDLAEKITPFSFFRWIFLHIDAHSEDELKQIIAHEYTHSRQWHSVDVILIELLCIAFWWNPFVWFIKREITINLEYLADNSVLQSGFDSRDYQYHLLRLTYHETAVQIVNNFNVSQLKNRILMMNKSKSPTRKLAKYLLAVPLTLLLIAGNSAFAQKTNPVKKTTSNNQKVHSTDEVFLVVEDQPDFIGGQGALMKYLGEYVKYPAEAIKQGIEGRVIVQFIIEKDGSISNVEVKRSIDPLLDKEAVRVTNSMPKWKPGKQNGENVRCQYVLPIFFRLSGDKKNHREVQSTKTDMVKVKADTKTHDDEAVFIVVEKQPQFPGGDGAMMKFLGENIKYPAEAHKQGIEGRVIAQFVIRKTGDISDVTIVRGVHPLLDAEAIRVINMMPKWTPGEQRGNKVNVRYTIPIVFKDNKKTKPTTDNADYVTVYDEKTEKHDKYLSYFACSLKYPAVAYRHGITGVVKASYGVDAKGNISDVKITKGVDPALDQEVISVIKNIPQEAVFAKTNGKAVPNVDFSVRFRLMDKETKKYIDSADTAENADIVVVGHVK